MQSASAAGGSGDQENRDYQLFAMRVLQSEPHHRAFSPLD
jgi:hypothetical protein